MRSIRFVRPRLFGLKLFAACLVLPTLAKPTHASTLSKAVRTSESMGPAPSFPEQEQNAAKSSISSSRGVPVQSPATSAL
jgi:hypothetical protein